MFDVLRSQVSEGLSGVAEADLTDVVVAYEPVWAIGTGKTASTDQAQCPAVGGGKQAAGHCRSRAGA